MSNFYNDYLKNVDLDYLKKFDILNSKQDINNIFLDFFNTNIENGIELGVVYNNKFSNYNCEIYNDVKATYFLLENNENINTDNIKKMGQFERISVFNNFDENEIPTEDKLKNFDEIGFNILKNIINVIEKTKNDSNYKLNIEKNIKDFFSKQNIETKFDNNTYIFDFFKYITQNYYNEDIYFICKITDAEIENEYFDKFINEFVENGILDNILIEINDFNEFLNHLDKIDEYNTKFKDSLISYQINCNLFENNITEMNIDDLKEKIKNMLNKMNSNQQFYRIFFANDYFLNVGFDDFFNSITKQEIENIFCSLDNSNLVFDCKKHNGIFSNYIDDKKETDFCLIH
jgi:hypothetical protein